MSDATILARSEIVEGAALAAGRCSWLADQSLDDGKLTQRACLWTALAGLAATVADLAEAAEHPTLVSRLARDCDGTESALLLLRAVLALRSGDRDQAAALATLAAKVGV